MSGKVGRPKEDNPKNKSIGLRLRKDDYDRLMDYTEEHNQTITQVVVDGLNLLYENASKDN